MNLRKFRPDIEGLRALAVLLVVLSHAGYSLKGGFVGVDVFFVISGFLITKHLFEEVQNTGTISLKKFYAKRVLRILPVSILVILLTLLASYFLLSPIQWINYCYDALLASLSGINYRLAEVGTNYFSTSNLPSPFQHYWSLAIEEQFYLIWPLLILVVVKVHKLLNRSRNESIKLESKKADRINTGLSLINSNSDKNLNLSLKSSIDGAENSSSKINFKLNIQNSLNLVLGIIFILSLYLSYSETMSSPVWAYFGLHTRAWELALGGLLAVNLNYFTKIPIRISRLLSWLGFLGITSSAILISEQIPYPGLWALVPTISTSIMILAGINKISFSFESLVNNPLIQWIGKISFSWYLIHWPLFVILLLNNSQINRVQRIAVVLLSLVLASISYTLVENPIRFNPKLKQSLKATFTLGLSLIILVVVICCGLIYMGKLKSDNAKQNITGEISNQESLNLKLAESLKLQKLPEGIPLELAATDTYAEDCLIPEKDYDLGDGQKCIFGDRNSKRTIVLLGDSHAHQWIYAFETLAKKYSIKLIAYTKGSCSMENIQQFTAYQNREFTECYKWREEVWKSLENIKPDVIVSTNNTDIRSNPKTFGEMLAKFQMVAKKVVVLKDTPHPDVVLKASVPDCLAKNKDNISNCNFNVDQDRSDLKVINQELELATSMGVGVIDTDSLFCFQKQCPSLVDRVVIYRDGSHITKSYIQYISPVVQESIIPFLPK